MDAEKLKRRAKRRTVEALLAKAYKEILEQFGKEELEIKEPEKKEP